MYKWDDRAWRGARNTNVMSAFSHDNNRVELRGSGDSILVMIFSRGPLMVSERLCHRLDGLDTAKVMAERRYDGFLKGR